MQNVSKRTILWIIPIIIIVIFWYFYGPQEEITDNEYITYIQNTTINENNSSTLETAFKNYCEENKWIYFKTQKNQNVVEFKGSCRIENQLNEVNLQFVIEEKQEGYQVGVLLLNGVQQTEEQRDKFLNIVTSNKVKLHSAGVSLIPH